jgi:hypothetical protein
MKGKFRVMTETSQSAGIDSIRTGSPFAIGSAASQPKKVSGVSPVIIPPEPIGEGVWRETAAAGGFSAWLLIAFGFAGWAWFPAGGAAISILGLAMSVLGLSSRLVSASAVALAIHAGITVACYLESL